MSSFTTKPRDRPPTTHIYKTYVIEINTLEELLALARENNLVVSCGEDCERIPQKIEIYDDWRE